MFHDHKQTGNKVELIFHSDFLITSTCKQQQTINKKHKEINKNKQSIQINQKRTKVASSIAIFFLILDNPVQFSKFLSSIKKKQNA